MTDGFWPPHVHRGTSRCAAPCWENYLRRGLCNFYFVGRSRPDLWLSYNALVYRNPLEFANGPYSAKAIEARTATPTSPSHPGAHDLPVAFSFFLKSAESNLAAGNLVQRVLVVLLCWGSQSTLIDGPGLWPLLLLLVPVPFYMLSIAFGGVPIFLPVWWPHSYYNARYGLELLPAFAVFTAIGVLLFDKSSARSSGKNRHWICIRHC